MQPVTFSSVVTDGVEQEKFQIGKSEHSFKLGPFGRVSLSDKVINYEGAFAFTNFEELCDMPLTNRTSTDPPHTFDVRGIVFNVGPLKWIQPADQTKSRFPKLIVTLCDGQEHLCDMELIYQEAENAPKQGELLIVGNGIMQEYRAARALAVCTKTILWQTGLIHELPARPANDWKHVSFPATLEFDAFARTVTTWDIDNDPPRSVSVEGYMRVHKVFASTNVSKYHAEFAISEASDPGARAVDNVICFHDAFQQLCQQSPEQLLSACEQDAEKATELITSSFADLLFKFKLMLSTKPSLKGKALVIEMHDAYESGWLFPSTAF